MKQNTLDQNFRAVQLANPNWTIAMQSQKRPSLPLMESKLLLIWDIVAPTPSVKWLLRSFALHKLRTYL
jgi:hypothetical protein